MWSSHIVPYTLRFHKPAATSRGALTERQVYFVLLQHSRMPGITGTGEAGTLPGLSMDSVSDPAYADALQTLAERLNAHVPDALHAPFEEVAEVCGISAFPSICFALETALLDLKQQGKRTLFDTPFSRCEAGIPINGLVWMDSAANMLQQAAEKIAAGFTCVKLKIGALDFDAECRLLERLRKQHNAFRLELRVDANGAFAPPEAAEQLRELARFELHSIEQPIRAGQWEAMAELCATSKLPVALDEELIGVRGVQQEKLLKQIRPRYLVLKPSLLGGFAATRIWIQHAESSGAGYWLTSALEGNIGLNAIAQFTATLNPSMPQGLGTGQLYTNNIASPLRIREGKLWMDPQLQWDYAVPDSSSTRLP